MERPTNQEMLKAGVHFGHQTSGWNPKMRPFIFTEKKGVHIIDLNRTSEKMEEAGRAMKQIAASGRKILFVATKKQARDIVKRVAQDVRMPYVTERWLGGMMTNFATIRRSVKKMESIEKLLKDDSVTSLTKKERLLMARQKQKLENVLGGIAELNRLPAAIFLVDINYEHIALDESRKLGMRTFAMVDTNSDPNLVDFPVPANDDSSKSIEQVVNYLGGCVAEGVQQRKDDQAAAKKQKEEQEAAKEAAKKEAEEAKKKAADNAAGDEAADADAAGSTENTDTSGSDGTS